MLKRTLFCSVIVMSVFSGLLVYLSFKEIIPKSQLADRRQRLGAATASKQKAGVAVSPVTQEINQRNAAVTNFVCESMEVKVWQGGHRFKLSGKLWYEKAKNFRLEINSVLGKEIDIGSNNKLFWYWSRRDKEPGVHYAYYEDFAKTRLKAPFSPIFLRGSLGLDVIEAEKALQTAENDTDIMYVFGETSGSGRPVYRSVFVSKENRRIDGFLLTDAAGSPIVSAELQEYSGGLPAKVLYTWHEEGKAMSLKFGGPRTNVAVNASLFQMPDYSPKLNMADRLFD